VVKPSRFVSNLAPYNITSQAVWDQSNRADPLKLDWNELPYDLEIYRNELSKISLERGVVAWYPDYLARDLTIALEEYVCLPRNYILSFPGSDSGLETLCRTYLEPDDRVVVLNPTYENFFIYVQQTGAVLDKVHTPPPFSIKVEDIIGRILRGPPAKAVYIVRPNNPCGYLLSIDDVKLISSSCPDTLVIVDEAYIEFSDASSCASLVASQPNIVVTRTFSKAFGMAGLRLGYLCADPTVAKTISKIRNGKNVSMLSQRLGLFALRNIEPIRDWINSVKKSRYYFESWCNRSSITYFPSHGNFVLFSVRSPNELCELLRGDGIYLRNRNEVLSGCIRTTIGSPDQMRRLTDALSKYTDFI
jgi:histidinol-phosphate aminotransferase